MVPIPLRRIRRRRPPPSIIRQYIEQQRGPGYSNFRANPTPKDGACARHFRSPGFYSRTPGYAAPMTTAFVLGGGGLLGAHEVGMLRALTEAGIRPDLVVGTSIGAINGAFVAADPPGAVGRLERMWQGDELRLAFSEKVWGRAVRLVRSGTHLHSLESLRRVLTDALPGEDFADLKLPFQCVAASIETASARWFSSGPVVPAVMASCAVPGLLPPVEVDGVHYFDGGLVDSIPVGRAVALGADPSTCCRWGGSRARWRSPPAPGRWGWWRSRSPGGTGSTRRCPRCPRTSGCTSCRPAGSRCRPVWRSSVTGTRLGWGQVSSERTRRRRGISPR